MFDFQLGASEACLDVSKCGLSWSSALRQPLVSSSSTSHSLVDSLVAESSGYLSILHTFLRVSSSRVCRQLHWSAKTWRDGKNTYLRKTNKKSQGQKTYSLTSMSYSKNLGRSRKLYFPVTLEFESEASEEAGIPLALWLLLKHVENLINLILLMRPCTSSSPVTFLKDQLSSSADLGQPFGYMLIN